MEESKANQLNGKKVSYNQGQGTKKGTVIEVNGDRVVIDNGKTKVTRKFELVKVIE